MTMIGLPSGTMTDGRPPDIYQMMCVDQAAFALTVHRQGDELREGDRIGIERAAEFLAPPADARGMMDRNEAEFFFTASELIPIETDEQHDAYKERLRQRMTEHSQLLRRLLTGEALDPIAVVETEDLLDRAHELLHVGLRFRDRSPVEMGMGTIVN